MNQMRMKFTSIDLFSGCGGLSLGLERAGFHTLAFSEINRDAGDTYWENFRRQDLERVGAVGELTNERIASLLRGWKKELGVRQVDLVCGGPPCQGYSGIGHRRSYSVERKHIPSNHLFREMVRVVEAVQPKMFLFENVRGLLVGRWTASERKGQIWDDVRETFGNLKGYEIGWRVVQAKWYGVPQNRPRVLLVGVQERLGLADRENRQSDVENNPRGLIPPPSGVRAPDLIDVLSDLDDPNFAQLTASTAYQHEPRSDFQKLMRKDRSGRKLRPDAMVTDHEFSKHSPRITEKFQHMLDHNGEIPESMRTKKFAQRLLPERWGEHGPTITATSLPDDFVHYARPRILTVREWARLQMFPDSFLFQGPRTTGGLRRAGVPTQGIWEREVPKYTQIGNAVPVGLAFAVGKHLASLLKKVK